MDRRAHPVAARGTAGPRAARLGRLAAGGLIGGAFLHLLPRAIAEVGTGDTLPLFLSLVAGFCLFYVLEGFIHWHHHAATHDHEPVTYLVLLSDTVHNFIYIASSDLIPEIKAHDRPVASLVYVLVFLVGVLLVLAIRLLGRGLA